MDQKIKDENHKQYQNSNCRCKESCTGVLYESPHTHITTQQRQHIVHQRSLEFYCTIDWN